MHLIYGCDKCYKTFQHKEECLDHEENCTDSYQQEENNTGLIVNISATLSGKEEINKAIDELQEKLKKLKINISL